MQHIEANIEEAARFIEMYCDARRGNISQFLCVNEAILGKAQSIKSTQGYI